MTKSKEEIMNEVQSIIGDRTDDAALAFIEDISEYVGSTNDMEDWKTKYEQNDAEWRERYKARFFGGSDVDSPLEDNVITENEETVIETFEDLFKEEM